MVINVVKQCISNNLTTFCMLQHAFSKVSVKAWANACNVSMQHLATLLGTTCFICLATLLWYVARCWMILSQIWKRSNFLCYILKVAWWCTRVTTFMLHCCTRTCALGPLFAHQVPGGHINIHMVHWKCWKYCVRFASLFNTCYNIMQQCCKMLRVFGQAFIFWKTI